MGCSVEAPAAPVRVGQHFLTALMIQESQRVCSEQAFQFTVGKGA